MNVTATGTHATLPEAKVDAHPGKKAVNASFQTINNAEIASIDSVELERGCNGVANELDMEAFFAAWGSDDANYDVDGNGTVDGNDLSMLLASQDNMATPGTVDDVLQQWGVEGDSSADLNGDGLVDGEDLVLALSGPAEDPAVEDGAERTYESRLEGLLADWGSNATRSDLNGDGTVDGLDLSQLLSEYEVSDNDPQGSTAAVATELPQFTDSASQTIIDPMASLRMTQSLADTKDLGSRIFAQLQEMGFDTHPPRNLTSLVDAFQLAPSDSKALLSNITDLFGAKDSKDIARG